MPGQRRALTATLCCLTGWLAFEPAGVAGRDVDGIEIDALAISDRVAIFVSAQKVDVDPRALGAATVARVGLRFRFIPGLIHGL